jgi:hypothetical protein
MTILQNSYSETVANGYAGMIANGETGNRISRTVEDAAGIGFGLAAFRGSGDNGVTATIGTAATFVGFTIAVQGQGLVSGETVDLYQQYDSAGVLTGGAIYVDVVGAVTDGAALTLGKGAGVADGIGATAADATHIALTGWVADETITDGLCRIVRR